MKAKVYVYGLCNVFYDAYYILGLKEVYGNFEFNISKFPSFKQGTFAVIIEDTTASKKIIIDSRDSNEIDAVWLQWCDTYGKINYIEDELIKDLYKIKVIGPSFGVKIWNGLTTSFYLFFNFLRFRNLISNKRDFVANYWRQYKRLRLKEYCSTISSKKEVFFISSIWKKEVETNNNRALFIEVCKKNPNIVFEGGFAARTDGDNLGFDALVYSKKIPLNCYLGKIKNSAIVFNTPAVLSCHGWKLAEFLALGKAIITTNHLSKLPADLIDYKHLIYANDKEIIEKAVNELIDNVDLKRKLEFQSRKYFEEYLTPKKVIQKMIEI